MFWLFRLLYITPDISGLLMVISACIDLGLHVMVAPLGGLIDSIGVCFVINSHYYILVISLYI